jgi:hypothetical protein
MLQLGVVSRRQAAMCCMSDSAIRHRIRPGGTWQVILPGIYLSNGGEPTDQQRVVAAYLYPGRALAVTGPAALAFHSIPAPKTNVVDVLVPLQCRRVDAAFVRLHRTGRPPTEWYPNGVVVYVPAARAVADTARLLSSITEVRAVVAAAVQRGAAQIRHLARELDAGPRNGSAHFRAVLAEVAAGVRSAAEAELLALIKRARLPVPLFNPRLYVGGSFLAMPDAWWEEAAVAVEVDSRQWHISPRDWERTLARHARMTAQGILVLHVPPARLRTDGPAVAAEIRAALSRGRALSHIVTKRE